MKNLPCVVLFSLLSASQLPAQAQLSGARLGFVHDAKQKVLRPLQGFPGGAVVGAPVGGLIERVFSSPGGLWHVIQTEGEWRLVESADPGVSLGVLSLASAEDSLVWSEDATEFVYLVALEGGLALSRQRLSPQRQWLPEEPVLLPESIRAGTALRLLALEKTAQGAVAWLAADGEAGSPNGSPNGSLWRWQLNENRAERVFSGVVAAFSVLSESQGRNSSYAVAEAGTSRISLLERVEGFWLQRPYPLDKPADRQVHSLRILPGEVLLSGWKAAPGAERSPPPLLLCTAPGADAVSIELEAPAETFQAISGTPLWLLRRSFREDEPVLIYDQAARYVFFVPLLGEIR
jgi:hypothetical protein